MNYICTSTLKSEHSQHVITPHCLIFKNGDIQGVSEGEEREMEREKKWRERKNVKCTIVHYRDSDSLEIVTIF